MSKVPTAARPALEFPDPSGPQGALPEQVTSRRARWLILIIVWGLSTAYMGTHLMRGWVPHDDGALAQSAERVLRGELPHRDFGELYSGGLSYLNAMAFRALGTNLASLRIVLFIFFLAWVPAVYFIASRFGSPAAGGGITLLAVAWSLPNYAAAIPSWYNLFFAVFGTAALLRHIETGARRWVFLAGICAGLSFSAKLSGLFFAAGALLFLVFRGQCLALAEDDEAPSRGRIFPVFLSAALLLFIASLCAGIGSRLHTAEFFHFVLPGVTLSALLIWREWRDGQGTDRRRFTNLLGLLGPFVAGAAVPIALFLIPYAFTGSLSYFVKGVFVLPLRRLSTAATSPPGLDFSLPALVLLALLGVAMYSRGKAGWFWRALWVLVLALALLVASRLNLVYQSIWYSVVLLVPLTVAAGILLLAGARRTSISLLRQQQVFLLLAVAGICSLVEFPFSAPMYFCYVAPLSALALLAVLSLGKGQAWFLSSSLLVFYLLFAVLLVTPSFIYAMGLQYLPDPETSRLALPRAGGLRVALGEAQEYEQLIPLLQAHAAGEYLYAAPDCPEVYFLSGLRNPTPTLFDFLDPPDGRTERILSALESHHVNAIAILTRPYFSPPLAPDLRSALARRYPEAATVGRFEVRWRP